MLVGRHYLKLRQASVKELFKSSIKLYFPNTSQEKKK